MFQPEHLIEIVGDLQDHEKCLILRKRSGKRQEEVAKEMSMSRNWLRALENGSEPCDALLAHWLGG